MASHYNERDMNLALQALKNDPKLKLLRAANIYGVPKSSLCYWHHSRRSRRDIQPNSRKLTDSEELAIIQYVLQLDSQGFPLRLSGVEDMANHLLAQRNAGRVGIR
jgi:hypothetical protein